MFIPCGNAPFAIVNRTLGQELSRAVLFTLQPARKAYGGFKAYYRECTPTHMAAMCEQNGLYVVEILPYYSSGYASFFAPFYTVDLVRQLALMKARVSALCESFIIVARKGVERSRGARRKTGF